MKRRFIILAAAFTLLAFLAIPKGAWATDVTFSYSTYSGQGTQSSGSEYTMVKTDVDITNTKFFGNTNYAHFYANGTTTITPKNGATITRIVLTATNTSYNGYQSGGSITASTGSVSAEGTTVTWTGSSSDAFTLDNNKQIRWTSIVVTYSSNSNVVDAPSFTPNGGIFLDSQEVIISCTTSGATIQYSTNNGSTWTNYTTPLTLTATTTVQAKATKSGMTDSEVATATFTKTTPLTTMQAIFDKATEVGGTATEVYITLNNWVVSGVSTNEKNVFVTDGTKGFVIYDGGGNMGFNVGDILSGTVYCKVQLYNGFAELTQLNATTSGLSIATGGTVTAANVAMADLTGVNTGALVHYENLTCSIDNNKYYLSDGTTTLQVFNSIFAFDALVADHVYNITGVYQQYNTTKEVLPRSAADIEEVASNIPTITAADVNITCDATSGAIEYTIENEVTGGVLTAATESEWLTLGAVGTTVPFTCSANTDADSRTATVTLTYTYNRATVTKEVTVTQAAYEAPHYTWNLSIASYASASTEQVTWTCNYATMVVDKANAGTNANNYLGGNQTSTRFYKNSELTITPVAGYAITSVVFNATTTGYALALQASTWTNATASLDDKVVTVIPTDGTIAMMAVISNTCGFTGVTVYYVEDDSPSIAANDVEIAYDATNGAITYTINNPVSGGVLTATTESEWLTLGTVGTTVPFTCSANATASPRTASVTLTYTYNTDQFVTKNVTVTQAGNPNTIDNISDITEAGTYTVQGTIVAISNRGFILGDGTGYVYYYYGSGFEYDNYSVDDIVKLSGSVVAYGGVFEFNASTTITYDGAESNYVEEVPTWLNGADLDAQVASSSTPQLSSYVQYEGWLSVSDGHYNITNNGATTAIGSISYPLNVDEITALNGMYVMVTGYYVGVSSDTYYNTMLESIEDLHYEVILLDTYDIEVAAEGGEGSVNVTYLNYSGSYCDVYFYAADGTQTTYDWITAELDSDYNVHYVVQPNTGEARTAYFKVGDGFVDDPLLKSRDGGWSAPAVNVYSDLVTVTQAANVVVGDYVRISSLDQLTDGSKVIIAARYDAEHTNGYYAMPSETTGRPEGVAFTSETSGTDEILPAAITNSEDTYYWTVNVTEDGYTFTNANNQMIGYTSGTNFATGGDNTEWTIESSTSESGLVPNYTGFIITNKNNTGRAFAFNGTVFGAYAKTNINAGYNFYLDFFVQTEASQTLTQTVELHAGTNWFSTYLEITLEDLQAALVAGAPTGSQITIAGSNANCKYSRNRWNGSLTNANWKVEEMYKITVVSDCEITLTGMPLDPAEHPITIKGEGKATWIGFPFSQSMSITDAFAEIATNNDAVKSEDNNSKFTRGRWLGGVTELVPGKGYRYISAPTAADRENFVFPTPSKTGK